MDSSNTHKYQTGLKSSEGCLRAERRYISAIISTVMSNNAIIHMRTASVYSSSVCMVTQNRDKLNPGSLEKCVLTFFFKYTGARPLVTIY